MIRENSIVRSTLFSSLGIYAEYVIGMLVSIIIARHLQPAGFGSYSVIIWMVALGVVFTNSGTGTAAIRFVAELQGSRRDQLIAPALAYLRRAQVAFLVVVLAVGAVALWNAGNRVVPELHHGWLYAFLVATISIRAMYMFNIGIAKGFQNFRATAIVAVVSAPITVVLVGIAAWMDAPVEAFLAIFVVSSVVLYVASHVQIVASIPASSPGISLPPELLARIKRHMRLTAITVALGFLISSEIEVLFLKLYASEGSAGQFKVAYQLATGAALLVPGVFGAILLPMMANARSQGAEVAAQRFRAATRYLTLLAAPLMAFGVVFSAAIISVLYGAAYAPAAPVFAACLVGGCLLTMTQGGSSLLVSSDRQGSLLAVVAVLSVAKIVLDVVLIKRFDLQGAVYAYWIIVVLDVVAIMALAIRASGASLQWSVLLRIALAALVGGGLAYPLLHYVPVAPSIVLGAMVTCAVYFPLTLALNCWTRGDIAYFLNLYRRLDGRRPGGVELLLQRAHDRAQE